MCGMEVLIQFQTLTVAPLMYDVITYVMHAFIYDVISYPCMD